MATDDQYKSLCEIVINHYNYPSVVTLLYRVQVPVRIMLDRNEDMIESGGRHPFLGKYKV